ncbi:MAG: transporter, partial [Planctomycetaceae bacterium]
MFQPPHTASYPLTAIIAISGFAAFAASLCVCPTAMAEDAGPIFSEESEEPERAAPEWAEDALIREYESILSECCPDCEGQNGSSAQGTLFLWSMDPEATGGPAIDEPLVTDRPDFTESSVTVGRGVTQIEFGYTYTYDRENGERTRNHSWGEPLVRHGIFADWLEMRVALFPVTEQTRDAVSSHTTGGTEDLYVGIKIALTPQAGFLPEMAIVPQATVPTGSPAFTNDEFLPGVNWLYSWDVTDSVSIAGSTQFNRAVEEIDTAAATERRGYTEWAQSASVGYGVCDEAGLYA